MSEEAERLYEQARALEPGTRAAFVEEACRGDPRLHEELVSLLEQAEDAEEFFDLLGDAIFSTPASIGGKKEGDGASHPASPLPLIELPIGTSIGRYRIQSLIGRGGMGVVYRAFDASLNREVALKFLPPLSTRLDDEDRLLQEAWAAAAMEHPNICTVHEIGRTHDGRPFIAMALYEGETLRERLRRGPMPMEDAVATAVQIARGLAAAHARGIVHRDIKPGNVILGSDGTARILDFGIALAIDAALPPSRVTPGTIAYMSPEQVRGDGADWRTDLWSLAVVLYEMLAGERPFRGDDEGALLGSILHDDPAPISSRLPELPAPLAQIVERLLHKNPADRYQSATEVLTELAHALPSGAGPSRPWLGSGAGAGVMAGSAAALVMLFAAMLWLSGRDGSSGTAATTGPREASIAVLPLANLSTDSRDAALADRMTEELIASLVGVGDLRVIGSTSAFSIRDRELDVPTIADSLRVSNVLKGSFQKIGSRLRMQVRLVNARDGSTRWSETYERQFNDVFSVQDEIARAVAGELDLRLKDGHDQQLLRRQTQNIAAYELYLRGNDPTLTRSDSGIREALGYFQQAIAADTTYAAAYAGVALSYVRLGLTRDPDRPLPELHALAEKAARKAVALDDSLGEARHALGRVRMAMLDFKSAQAELRRAIALDPTDWRSRGALATLHIWAGRPAEALTEARRALETDPLSPYANVAAAEALFMNHRYDEALAQLEHITAIRPPLRWAAAIAGQCHARKGRWPEAIAALRQPGESGDPLIAALLGHTLANAAQREEARRILARLITRRERAGTGAFEIAAVYAGLGEFDQAFSWLHRSLDDYSLKVQVMGPTFDELRGDPRFEIIRTRLGLQKL